MVSSALKPFDPWTSSAAEALRAHELHGGDGPGPLAQHQAAQQVLGARPACLTADGGCELMRCTALCLANRLEFPGWLADAFVSRHARVIDADVGTWDEAFGAPWPPRTRLHAVRQRRKLKRLVYAAVWDRITGDPAATVNRVLFDEIGELPGVAACGSACETAYYEAIADGEVNPLTVRVARRQSFVNC